MGKIKMLIICIAFLFFNVAAENQNIDLTLVSPAVFADGICRISIGLIDALKNDLKINFIKSGPFKLNDIPQDIKKVIESPYLRPGNVSLLLDAPWHKKENPALKMPKSNIKLAYSMLEGTEIPKQWVDAFNNKFDAVIVPDDFLVIVYKNSGVSIPIFILPHGIYLEEFFKHNLKKQKNTPFVFGTSATFMPGKNHDMVIDAFEKAFGNRKDVKLRLHGRSGIHTNNLIHKIKARKLNNIEIIHKILSQKEYINFFCSLDCYILLSKGEGFSVTPREALSLGIPCILSNNTAHETICKTGLVKSIECPLLEPAFYPQFATNIGNKYNCKIEDSVEALLDVYNNYDYYLTKAHAGREWVKQYLWANLKSKFLNLIKPKEIIYGKDNVVTEDYLMTNSLSLYQKYKKVLENS